jgi:hypothetical protein
MPSEHYLQRSSTLGLQASRNSSRSARLTDERHANELRKAIGSHLVHHIGSVDFHGARADAEVESDLLIGPTLDLTSLAPMTPLWRGAHPP